PDRYAESFISAGADHITIHMELDIDIHNCLAQIHELGASAGLCIKPDTNPKVLNPYLDEIDVILVMTVEPGFSGQSFLPDAATKISTIKEMIGSRNIHIQVDGGISVDTVRACTQHGANICVAASSIFKNPMGTNASIKALRVAAEK
ncbi:MAG: ribulose-phosphate 3-epimerase, partial [Lentisphaeria bacterium]|nr:ribulose-phosphate 3-epimerase [Lentisphaeria bacterium]